MKVIIKISFDCATLQLKDAKSRYRCCIDNFFNTNRFDQVMTAASVAVGGILEIACSMIKHDILPEVVSLITQRCKKVFNFKEKETSFVFLTPHRQ